jgi:hypothetical protein
MGGGAAIYFGIVWVIRIYKSNIKGEVPSPIVKLENETAQECTGSNARPHRESSRVLRVKIRKSRTASSRIKSTSLTVNRERKSAKVCRWVGSRPLGMVSGIVGESQSAGGRA